MTANRTERLMDVVFVLLNARSPITREQIFQRVPGYDQDSDEALQKMFERDKKALRDMGVPIEMKSFDVVHDDQQGYWLDRKAFLLPDLHLTSSERLLITLAASAWEDQQISSVARDAAHRMGTKANRPSDAPDMRIGVGLTTVADLFAAINSHHVVQFQYHSKSSDVVSDRVVQPWRLLLTSGAWYLVGFDEERDAMRTFRLTRILGAVVDTGRECDRDVPADLDTRELVESWAEIPGSKQTATIRIQPGTCANLRLRAREIELTDDGDTLVVEYGHEPRLVREIATVCADVISVEPESLRDSVTQFVRHALEVNS